MAVITPAAATLFLPIPIATFAGKAMPLSIVVAFAVTFVIMNAIFRFSRRIAHAGSFYAFVRASLGIEAGFFAGWLMMAFYSVLVGLDMILFGATLNGLIVAPGGPTIPWWLLMIIGLAIIWPSGSSASGSRPGRILCCSRSRLEYCWRWRSPSSYLVLPAVTGTHGSSTPVSPRAGSEAWPLGPS